MFVAICIGMSRQRGCSCLTPALRAEARCRCRDARVSGRDSHAFQPSASPSDEAVRRCRSWRCSTCLGRCGHHRTVRVRVYLSVANASRARTVGASVRPDVTMARFRKPWNWPSPTYAELAQSGLNSRTVLFPCVPPVATSTRSLSRGVQAARASVTLCTANRPHASILRPAYSPFWYASVQSRANGPRVPHTRAPTVLRSSVPT